MKVFTTSQVDLPYASLSVEHWNLIAREYLLKYFASESSLSKNKELLRVEILNFIKLKSAPEYFFLFEEIFGFYISVLEIQNEDAMKLLNCLLPTDVEVDAMWTGLANRFSALTPDIDQRDAIAEKFGLIENVLESVYRPRMFHLYRFAELNSQEGIPSSENLSFGDVIDRFPKTLFSSSLLFCDPIYGIPTNQWRNILCHKSFDVMPDKIKVKYGKRLQHIVDVKHGDVDRLFRWVDFSYCALRLAQVLIYLRIMPDLLEKFGAPASLRLRFDAVFIGILHNIRLVGFEYRAHSEAEGTFELSLYPESLSDIQKSTIHATQFFDQIALGIDSDDFYRDKLQTVCVKLYSKTSQSMVSCASAKISDLLDRMDKRLSLPEQISRINFSFNDVL